MHLCSHIRLLSNRLIFIASDDKVISIDPEGPTHRQYLPHCLKWVDRAVPEAPLKENAKGLSNFKTAPNSCFLWDSSVKT